MAFIHFINETLFLPINDLFLGRPMYKNFKFLNKSQWWSEEQLKDYQDKKLRALIHHAYLNVPYYTEVFNERKLKPKDIKSQEDLHKLPLLTKEIIRKNFPDKMQARNISPKKLILSGSGGSTGEPLQYYRTKKDLSFARACNLRAWYWMGYRLGDRYIKISTMPRNSWYKKLQDFVNLSLHLHTKSFSDKDIEQLISIIRKKKYKFLRGYPASLFIIANYMEKKQINDIFLKGINTTSEPLYPYMRELIENKFHCPIFDSYSAEGGPVIAQCEYKEFYHIASEKSICEFHKNNDPAFPDLHKIIFTDLHNYATPFIRYDVKDYVSISNKDCICGRKLGILKKIEGRDSDILITPSGRYITFYFFIGYFEHKNYLDLFQMQQNSLTEFTLKIVVNKNFSPRIKETIYKDFIEVLGKDVNLSIEITQDIPLAPSGKRRFFIRNPEIRLDLES